MVNRTQGLVLGFLAFVWVSLAVIVALAPEVYDRTLNVPNGDRTVEVGFVAALSALIAFLAVAVVRRWRWAFWLIVVAFLAGLLRIVASVLELAGSMPAQGPPWYTVLQAVIGAAQLLIAMAMIAGYRKHGVWGRF